MQPDKQMENVAPKNQELDCDMVTTTSPPKLTTNEWNLFEMARSNRIDGLKHAIESRKANLNVRDKFDRTPLHFAASEGNLAAVRLLLEGHAVVDVYDKFGITPLLWAVYNNHKSVVQFLLEKGAKHTKVTKQGHTIVHFVAESNAIGILKHLYQKYRALKIDEQDKAGLTPFLVAAGRGNQTLMEVFVRQKCNVLATDKRNRTAIHIAAYNGQMTVLRYLLRMPQLLALKDILDYDQKSALHYAAFANHQEIIRTLLAAGCDPNIDSEKHDCPLIAVSRKGFHSCIDTLLTYGADKEKRTKVGNSALHVACLANLPDTVQFLVWRHFDLLARNKRGQTPLHISVEQNKIETVELLILIGAPLNVRDDDNSTPLEVAAKASHTALVDLIIKAERWHQKCPVESEEVRYQMMNTTAQLNESADNASELAHGQSFLGLGGGDSYYSPQGAFHTIYDPPGRGSSSADYVLSGVPSPRSGRTLEPVSEDAEFADRYHSVFSNGLIAPRSPSTSGSLRQPRRPDYASTVGSDSLSLGYEASRAWGLGPGGAVAQGTYHQQSGYNGDVRSIRSEVEDRRSLASSSLPHRPRKRATTQHLLPNGEMVIRLGETYVPSTEGARLERSGTLVQGNADQQFSLLHYKHPYAEEMKVMLFGLAHNDLKPGDWKKLAHLWEFTNEQIEAIESQDIGKNSYKEHGYRMFDIWIHGVNKDSSPMNDLYQGLVNIGRNKLAHHVRKKLESGSQHKTCSIQ